MTKVRWEQYPLVGQHEFARKWLQRQAHLQLAPATIDASGQFTPFLAPLASNQSAF